jgi:nucleotide-binding universal stress UspA family protein
MTAFRRILVPHDFSKHATRALQTAVELLAPGGRLVVLHVVVPILPVADITTAGIVSYISPEDLVRNAKRQLARAIDRTVPAKLRARVEAKVAVGDPHVRILVEARDADLVVMSTAGRTGLAHLLIGSVAEKVVRHSPVPVLTFRPRAARAKKTRR